MLTQVEIRIRSTTLKGAIEVSKQHWQEIATASKTDLIKASKFITSAEFCGLCHYYRKIREKQYCLLCPYYCGIGTMWLKAHTAYNLCNWNKLREYAAQIVIELGKL